MVRLNQRGAVPIQAVIVLILLAGLAAGLFLVRQTQIFKPKAAVNQTCYDECRNGYALSCQQEYNEISAPTVTEQEYIAQCDQGRDESCTSQCTATPAPTTPPFSPTSTPVPTAPPIGNQYSTCGAEQVAHPGYDYCNDPANGGFNDARFACDISNNNHDPTYGDGCYVSAGCNANTGCGGGGGTPQCPSNATACWHDAGCPAPGTSQQNSADISCKTTHQDLNSRCDPVNPGFGDGCTTGAINQCPATFTACWHDAGCPAAGTSQQSLADQSCKTTYNDQSLVCDHSNAGSHGDGCISTASSTCNSSLSCLHLPFIQSDCESASGQCSTVFSTCNCGSNVTPSPTPGGGGGTTLTVSAGNVTCTSQTTATVPLSWTNVSGVTNYDVFRGTIDLTNPRLPATQLSYTDANVPPNSNFFYTVKGLNASGGLVVYGDVSVNTPSCSGGGGGGPPPTCRINIVCTGTCQAPVNTCSNNGIQAVCNYTGGETGCTPAPALNQPCSVDNCASGYACNAGQCTPNATVVPTATPIPGVPTATLTPTPVPSSVVTFAAPSCTDSSNPNAGYTFAWNNTSSPVIWVDISTDQTFNSGYYHKGGSASDFTNNFANSQNASTNATGFGGFNGASGTLSFVPGTKYYIRTNNGTNSLFPHTDFTAPAACAGPTNTQPPNQPTNTPVPLPTGTGTTYCYRVAETAAGLGDVTSDAGCKPYNSAAGMTDKLTFSNSNPEEKFVFVLFIGRDQSGNRITEIKSAPITLLRPPSITGCNISPIGGSGDVNIEILGTGFGSSQGSRLISGNSSVTFTSWTDTTVTGKFTNPPTGQEFPVTLTTVDGLVAQGACSALSQLAVGAQLFCPQVSDVSFPNTEVTIIEAKAGATPITEKVTLKVLKANKVGVIEGLKTKLQKDKGYRLAIKVPKGVRRVLKNDLGGFIAVSGTTNVDFTKDGKGAKLPLGDIFPVGTGDGAINAADYVQLKRDIAAANPTANTYSDLNQDTWVNSFEWACMRPDIGTSDEPIPAAGALNTAILTPAAIPTNAGGVTPTTSSASPSPTLAPNATTAPTPTTPAGVIPTPTPTPPASSGIKNPSFDCLTTLPADFSCKTSVPSGHAGYVGSSTPACGQSGTFRVCLAYTGDACTLGASSNQYCELGGGCLTDSTDVAWKIVETSIVMPCFPSNN